MKVVIAPDKFAGTLTALEAAEAMAEGWGRVRPSDDLVQVPMADGGEGTLDVVAAATAATIEHAEVADARAIATTARWARLADGRALVESAEALGLSRLDPASRDPLTATSYGAGQLLWRAAQTADEVVVSLGGSATVDGGAGAVGALGHRLLRADGNGLKVGAGNLVDLDRVVPGAPLPAAVVVATDVTNPLLGPDGAAAVFGPQKGADDDAVAELERCLSHWADVVERDLPGGPWRDRVGAGAAGGLGFALMAFTAARVEDGARLVAELVGLEEAMAGADVVLTGEGRLDRQTFEGKAPGYVAERARAGGARVLAIAGRLADGAERLVDDARELGPEGMERPAELVGARAAELAEVSGAATG